jgi:hypothetical protein
MNLCLLDDLKLRLAIKDDEKSAQLNDMIAGVSAVFERYLGRTIQSGATNAHTEYHDVHIGQTVFNLPAYPVTSITTVHNDTAWVYGSSTLVAATSYKVNTTTGLLYFDSDTLIAGHQALKVVYVGGMAETAAAFALAYPDIAEACMRQATYWFNTKSHVGAMSVGAGGATQSFGFDDDVLLAGVRGVLDLHRNVVAV